MAQWHQIRGNETIGSIAGMYGATPFQLLGANPGMGNTLAAGSYLRVPTIGSLNVGTGVGGYSTQQLNAKQLGFGTTQSPSPIGPPAPPVPGTGSFLTGAGTPRLPQSAMPQGTYNARYREFIPNTAGTTGSAGRLPGGGYTVTSWTGYNVAIAARIANGEMPEQIAPQFIQSLDPVEKKAFLQSLKENGYVEDAKTGYFQKSAFAPLTEQEIAAGVVGRDEKTGSKIYNIGGTYVDEKDIGGAGRRKGESYFNPKTGNWRTNGAGRRRDTTADNNGGDGGTARKANTMTMNVGWRIG